ncbi:hypothetical protein K457DRAFT_798035 [Linnemannia elongata AG-77]|uniref:Uncharacterized protein n=1 Tax=Linnemannia elongata AG-77 TaxID=1314771 RepID=A0A197JIP7_9FUNG|nr:hypothetical protein K457DRAFT_798035 [Linnemannia elongata AG-77]
MCPWMTLYRNRALGSFMIYTLHNQTHTRTHTHTHTHTHMSPLTLPLSAWTVFWTICLSCTDMGHLIL